MTTRRAEEEPVSSTTIASAVSSRGELVLRRREWDGELELRVNGVFVMDSYETATERALAVLALDSITRRRADEGVPLKVMVGGLGLGYTLAQFASSPLVGTVTVAEIEPALVEWHQTGLVPLTDVLAHDPRIQLLALDVQAVVAAQAPGSLDVIVLDVDNGPGYLVYDANASVYQPDFLTQCRESLADKGVVVVWSADRAPELAATLRRVFGTVSHHSMAVRRGDRHDHYHAYVAPAHPDHNAPEDEVEDDTEGEPCPAR